MKTQNHYTKLFLQSLRAILPEPPSTNFPLSLPKHSPYSLLPPHATILDVGGKTTRGRYQFGAPPEGSHYICLDIEPSQGVDIIADAHDLQSVLPANSVDCILAISVLEHTTRPWIVVSEFARILKPNGILYVNTPWVFPYHDDPADYYRFSHLGLQALCHMFEPIESGYSRGPASSLVHICSHGAGLCFSLNRPKLYSATVYLLKWLLHPLKYLDIYAAKHPKMHVIANGAFFLGRKPSLGTPR